MSANDIKFSSYPMAKKVLKFLEDTKEAYPAKIISKRLGKKYNAIRRYLYSLEKIGLIFSVIDLGIKHYQIAEIRPEIPERSQALMLHDIVLKWEHGNTFRSDKKRWKIDLWQNRQNPNDFTNRYPPVGNINTWRNRGKISFQNEGGVLMVYYSCSKNPLIVEQFISYCEYIMKYTQSEFVDNDRWEACQLGIGKDHDKTFIESFGGSISLHSAVRKLIDPSEKELIARIYKKKDHVEGPKVREEFHIAEMTLETVIASLRGGIATSDALNIMTRTSVMNSEVIKAINGLSQKVDHMTSAMIQLLQEKK